MLSRILGARVKTLLIPFFLAALAGPALADPAPFAPVPDTSASGPVLPEGVLRPISLLPDDGVAFFLIEDSVVRRGDQVDYWALMIFDPPKASQSGVVRQGIFHMVVDCKARTARKLFFAAYGETGPSLVAEGTPDAKAKPLVTNTGPWFQAEVLCDGDEDTLKYRVTGDAAAIEAASGALRGAKGDK